MLFFDGNRVKMTYVSRSLHITEQKGRFMMVKHGSFSVGMVIKSLLLPCWVSNAFLCFQID